MSFGFGNVSQFQEQQPMIVNQGPGEGIKGSPYFKYLDAIVKTVASFYTYGATTGMAVSAWKKALTEGDTSQGKVQPQVRDKWAGTGSQGSGGGPGVDPYRYGKEMAGVGQSYIQDKLKELASKAGGAGGPAADVLGRYDPSQGGGNPYMQQAFQDLSKWKEQIGTTEMGNMGGGYDTGNPWESLLANYTNTLGGSYGDMPSTDWAQSVGDWGSTAGDSIEGILGSSGWGA